MAHENHELQKINKSLVSFCWTGDVVRSCVLFPGYAEIIDDPIGFLKGKQPD